MSSHLYDLEEIHPLPSKEVENAPDNLGQQAAFFARAGTTTFLLRPLDRVDPDVLKNPHEHTLPADTNNFQIDGLPDHWDLVNLTKTWL